MFEQYKEYKYLENERDTLEADLQIVWFTEEQTATKYNSHAEAVEKLGIWQERKNGLVKRKLQLDEMFKLYEKKRNP
jgi:hypothetical protein